MRVSPQKARLVLDLIKGRRVEDALNTLIFTKKRVAATVEKLLRSALENANYLSAEKGIDVDVDKPLREAGGRQRRTAHEAHTSGADGPSLSLRAAHRAYRDRAGGAGQEWRSAGQCGRRGESERHVVRSVEAQSKGKAKVSAGKSKAKPAKKFAGAR